MKRFSCAMIGKNPPDHPCAKCPNPCGHSSTELQIIFAACRGDYESVLAWIWAKRNPRGIEMREIAAEWLSEDVSEDTKFTKVVDDNHSEKIEEVELGEPEQASLEAFSVRRRR